MSTVLHCYKVSKKHFWPVVDEVRGLYKSNHTSYRLVESMSAKCTAEPGAYWDAMKRLKGDDELTTCLQLFDPNKPYWLFRVLSADYYFMNTIQVSLAPLVTPVFFDDRTDIPKDHRCNKHTANWIDNQITARRYMLVPIVDTDSLQAYLRELVGL